MPTYLTPGVYVEEIPSSSKPIEGVGTSVAAFVGLAQGGPINTPMRVSSWPQFERLYTERAEPDAGPYVSGGYLAHAVYGFFQNGGSNCWVVRIGSGTGAGRSVGREPVALREGLAGLADIRSISIVCAPDISASSMTSLTRRRTSSSTHWSSTAKRRAIAWRYSIRRPLVTR